MPSSKGARAPVTRRCGLGNEGVHLTNLTPPRTSLSLRRDGLWSPSVGSNSAGGRVGNIEAEQVAEAVRVARGQIETLRFVERWERRNQGRPVLELMPDEPEET